MGYGDACMGPLINLRCVYKTGRFVVRWETDCHAIIIIIISGIQQQQQQQHSAGMTYTGHHLEGAGTAGKGLRPPKEGRSQKFGKL